MVVKANAVPPANAYFARRLGKFRKPHHIMSEHLALRHPGVDAHGGAFRKSGGLFAGGQNHGFSETHHPQGDSGSLAGGGVAKVDAGIHGRRGFPEFPVLEEGEPYDAGRPQF